MDTWQIYSHQFGEPPEEFPFLLHANRLGCTKQGPEFCVQREEEYPYFTVHFLLDGCGFFRISGSDYLLKKGDAFLITSNQQHLYKNHSSEPMHMLWIEFFANEDTDVFRFFKEHPAPVIDAAFTQKPQQELMRILRLIQRNEAGNAFELSALYYRFLMYLMEAVSPQPLQKQNPIIRRAVDYISVHIKEPVSVQKLADHLHISRSHLTRCFRQYMGISPIRYIHMKRIELACQLLSTTTMTCEQIANEVGMYDASHFHKLFCQNLGCSPSAYRKENQFL